MSAELKIEGSILIPASVAAHVGAAAALFLADIAEEWCYRRKENRLYQDMVYRSFERMEERTGLSGKQQRTVVSLLESAGYCEAVAINHGMQRRRYFKLSEEVKIWAQMVYGRKRPLGQDDPALEGLIDPALEGRTKNGIVIDTTDRRVLLRKSTSDSAALAHDPDAEEALEDEGVPHDRQDTLEANHDATTRTAKDVGVADRPVGRNKILPPDDPAPFQAFWDLYAKPEGRYPSERKWASLPLKDRLAVMDHLPYFLKLKPERQFRPLAMTYLNQKRWLDGTDMPADAGPRPPTLAEAHAYRMMRGWITRPVDKWFLARNTKDWKVKGDKIVDWKSDLELWMMNEQDRQG